MKGKVPGSDEEVHLQLVKGTREGRTVGVDYISQVILTAEDDAVHHVLLTKITEPEQLEAKINELNLGKLKQVKVITTEPEKELVEKLTSFLPVVDKAQWEELPMSGKTFTSTQYEVTDRYFRAIAKIAFHYVLKHFPQFRGDEQMFSGIRNFIMNGGDIADFVGWSEKQVIEIKEGYTPSTFAHIITARATHDFVWCRLQFFLGPQTTPFVYKVGIARNETKLVYDVSSGHSFVYYQDGLKDGFIGQMDPLIWIHKP